MCHGFCIPPLTKCWPRYYHSQYNLRANYNKVCVRLHGCCLLSMLCKTARRETWIAKKPRSAGDLPDEDDFRRSGAGWIRIHVDPCNLAWSIKDIFLSLSSSSSLIRHRARLPSTTSPLSSLSPPAYCCVCDLRLETLTCHFRAVSGVLARHEFIFCVGPQRMISSPKTFGESSSANQPSFSSVELCHLNCGDRSVCGYTRISHWTILLDVITFFSPHLHALRQTRLTVSYPLHAVIPWLIQVYLLRWIALALNLSYTRPIRFA